MISVFKAGLTIAILCAIWQVVMVMSGWMTDPKHFSFFYLVILIEFVVLIWGLKLTAATNGYGMQVLAGTGMSLLAGILLFLFSFLMTTTLFPNLLREVTAMQVGTLKQAGRSEAEIAAFASLQTPLIHAVQGLLGTVVTGLLASLVIGIFLRRKK
jgi:hypothetical protein